MGADRGTLSTTPADLVIDHLRESMLRGPDTGLDSKLDSLGPARDLKAPQITGHRPLTIDDAIGAMKAEFPLLSDQFHLIDSCSRGL